MRKKQPVPFSHPFPIPDEERDGAVGAAGGWRGYVLVNNRAKGNAPVNRAGTFEDAEGLGHLGKQVRADRRCACPHTAWASNLVGVGQTTWCACPFSQEAHIGRIIGESYSACYRLWRRAGTCGGK